MEIKEAKEIIHAGIAWANWTEEQKEAMRIALKCMNEHQELSKKVQLIEPSLQMYKDENETYETSTHIDEFLYEFNVNEKGEIPCLIKVHGVTHSFGITRRDARGFNHLFEMHKGRMNENE